MKYTWLVEKYLEGELKGRERNDFELMILKDPSVAEEVERIQKLNAFCVEQHNKLKGSRKLVRDFDDEVHIPGTDELMNDLDSLKIRKISDDEGSRDLIRKIRKTLKEATPEKRQAKMLILAKHNFWFTAASFALILAVSVFLLSRTYRKSDPLVASEQFYHPYTPELTVRNPETSTSNVYLSGLQEYREANYSLALDYFNASIAQNPGNLPVYLFKGISLMELGDFGQALATFRQLHSDALLDEYGQWYSGLCCLQLGRPDDARKIFRDLSEQKGYFSSLSRSVLKQF